MNTFVKPRVAFFDFTGCEGCQLTVIDALQRHSDLLEAVEIVQFREAMSERCEDYQIAFVEGSCSRTGDESRLLAIRERAEIVVALGACAHLGGVNALRNQQSAAEVRRYVYGQFARLRESHKALPIQEVMTVDCIVPGCPIDGDEFIRTVKALLQGHLPRLPDYPLCAECKLAENECLFKRQVPCLGPVTRAGCGAICPGFGAACAGCRGLVPNANLEWLRVAAAEHGHREGAVDEISRLFLSHALMGNEGDSHGQH
jgi:sulfhydrogenase subunit delta